MKNKIIFKTVALITSCALFFTCSSLNFSEVLKVKNNASEKDFYEDIVSVSSTTSSDPESASAELLMNAFSNSDKAEMEIVCRKITECIENSRREFRKVSEQVYEIDSPEIQDRQKKYEDYINIKYAQTLEAVENVRKGIDVESNVGVICQNLNQPDHAERSDAAGNILSDTEFSEADVYAAPEEEIISPDYSEKDLKFDFSSEDNKAIIQLADSLKTPDNIFKYVKNNIKNEYYTGLKKGPAGTLGQSGGSDTDQAALLVSMLRAEGIPARFVSGTIRITAEQGMSITGAENTSAAGRMLNSPGKNVSAVANETGEIVAFVMKHIWVEAYIPYTDYRGAGNKSGDKVWIQLDPWCKSVNCSVKTVSRETDEQIEQNMKILEETAEKYPDIYKEVQFSSDPIKIYFREIAEDDSIYLPNSLPYSVLNVDGHLSEISSEEKDSIAFYVEGEEICRYALSDLYNKEIIVSYEPVSQEDKDVIDRFSNLTEVPAYLVHVYPVISVNGEKHTGHHECTLGMLQQFTTEIKNNGGTRFLNDTVSGGSVYAVNLDLQHFSVTEAGTNVEKLQNLSDRFTEENAYSPEILGPFVSYAGYYYFSLCDNAEEMTAAVDNINLTRQLGYAMTGYQFNTKISMGMVQFLTAGSFFIDVAYNSMAAVSVSGDKDMERNYLLTLGEIESNYEGFIWEKLLSLDSTGISTVSVMKAAYEAGITNRYICSSNLEQELSMCHVSESVKNEVRNYVNQGLYVEIVPETMVINGWTGTAYTVINMSSGENIYMISGGNAGGTSGVFEGLFNVNIQLAALNEILGIVGLTADLLSGGAIVETLLWEELLKDDIGYTIANSITSYGSVWQMKYDTYDYIFDYAERGDDCLDDFWNFTFNNVCSTLITIGTMIIPDITLLVDLVTMAHSVYSDDLDKASVISYLGDLICDYLTS